LSVWDKSHKFIKNKNKWYLALEKRIASQERREATILCKNIKANKEID